MPGRHPPGRHLDQFRLAIAENVTMSEAGQRLADREDAARLDTVRRHHGEAMRRLYAKGYGRTHRSNG